MNPLTEIQRKVYDFIVSHKSANGIPPTRAEIAGHFGWASANSAQGHLKAIQKKGWITLLGHKRARGVVINPCGHHRAPWFVRDPQTNTGEG